MYKCIVNMFEGKSKVFYFSKEEAEKAGKIQKLIYKQIPQHNIKRIYVRSYNEHIKKHYLEVVYDCLFSLARSKRARIEVIYKWGEKEQFLIGKSTGWTPCYIALKRKDSRGGDLVLMKSIKSWRVVSLAN